MKIYKSTLSFRNKRDKKFNYKYIIPIEKEQEFHWEKTDNTFDVLCYKINFLLEKRQDKLSIHYLRTSKIFKELSPKSKEYKNIMMELL